MIACAANLRSIGQAMTMYTQRYGYYPSCYVYEKPRLYAIWPVRLRPFTGGDQDVFYCPAQDEQCEWKKVDPLPGAAGRATAVHALFGYEVGEPLLDRDATCFSYAYNGYGCVDGNDYYYSETGLGQTLDLPGGPMRPPPRQLRASRVLKPAQMIAVTDATADGAGDFGIAGNASHPKVYPGAVHNGGPNVLFCDGHVEWFRQRDIMVTYNQVLPSEYPIRRMWNHDHLLYVGSFHNP